MQKENQDIAIIFKREKLKSKNKYKLIPLLYVIGTLEEKDEIKYLKIDEELVKKAKNQNGIISKYNFAENANALTDEYIFGFPITVERVKEVFEDDDDDYLQLFLEEYMDAISDYNYYQEYDQEEQTLICYSTPKQYINKEYQNMAIPNISALQEHLGFDDTDIQKVNFTKEKSLDCTTTTNHIDIKNLYINITSSLIGQDEQVKSVLSAIDINQTITNPRLKQNILICGDTGTGKTEMFRLIANHLNIPYVVEDATQYTMAGYVGKNVDEMLVHLLVKADNNIQKAQRGILIVDEIDKKANGTNDEKISTTAVLESLLKLMEGGIYNFEYQKNKSFPFDTTNMTFVAIGAFSGLSKIANPKTVGFNQNSKIISPYSTENFNKYGLLPEFIGRCNRKIIMNPMTKEILSKILTTSQNSPLLLFKELFENYGISLTLKNQEEIINEIAEEALKLKTGARSLFEIVNTMVNEALYQVQSEKGKYKKLILRKETVKDNHNYILK